MSEWNFVIAAYVVTWIGLIGYAGRLLMLNRRARALSREAGGVR